MRMPLNRYASSAKHNHPSCRKVASIVVVRKMDHDKPDTSEAAMRANTSRDAIQITTPYTRSSGLQIGLLIVANVTVTRPLSVLERGDVVCEGCNIDGILAVKPAQMRYMQ
jgi:hypothetical protein